MQGRNPRTKLREWTLEIVRDIIQKDIQDVENCKKDEDHIRHGEKENIIRKLKRLTQGAAEVIGGIRDANNKIINDLKGMVKEHENH